ELEGVVEAGVAALAAEGHDIPIGTLGHGVAKTPGRQGQADDVGTAEGGEVPVAGDTGEAAAGVAVAGPPAEDDGTRIAGGQARADVGEAAAAAPAFAEAKDIAAAHHHDLVTRGGVVGRAQVEDVGGLGHVDKFAPRISIPLPA